MSEVKVAEHVKCTHCGELCEDQIIVHDDLHFCCTGCETVYDLLNENGLSTYYALENVTPGISMRAESPKTEFSHLDHPSVSAKILDFTDGQIAHVTLKLPQIHCSSCIWLLENLHRLNSAIKQSQVFFGKREASIQFDIQKLPLSGLASLLTKIGYRPDFSLEAIEGNKKKNTNRPLLLKIGIAGFSFGNIMLFSLPEYFAGPGGLDTQFLTLFGGLNIILALPVFFYSSLDFFRPALSGIRSRQWNMDIAISLGIIAMFTRSLYEILTGVGVGYMDSFTMLVFFLLVGRLFQLKTFETLSFERDYKSYFPLSVIRLIDGIEESVAATLIKEDDTLLIRKDELLPADSILIDSLAEMDFSFVTGESKPVTMKKGEIVYAGGRNTGIAARFKTLKPVSGSYLTSLWNNDVFAKEKQYTLKSLSQQFSRFFSPIVIGIAIISALAWLPFSGATSVNVFTAVLIIACPCALALSAPFTLGWSTNILSRNKYYLKNAEVTEHLARINTIVFDKTGTLTSRDDANVKFVGRELSTNERGLLLAVMHQNTHPLGRHIYRHLKYDANASKIYEIDDFQHITGKGIKAIIGKNIIKAGSSTWVGSINQDYKNIEASRVFVSFNNEIAGFFEIQNQLRSGVGQILKTLKEKAQLFLLSGDNDHEKNVLLPYFSAENELLFNQSPEDKLQFVQNAVLKGKHVLMMGDGLNDSGALQTSTVGVSIAEDTGSFTPASDIIMEAGSITKLPSVLSFSKESLKIIKISFAISVLYNIIGLGFAVSGTLSPLVCAIIMPISSISVIGFTTLATHYAAWKKGLLK